MWLFLSGPFFKSFLNLLHIASVVCVVALRPWSRWDVGSPARDPTLTLHWKVKFWLLDLQGTPELESSGPLPPSAGVFLGSSGPLPPSAGVFLGESAQVPNPLCSHCWFSVTPRDPLFFIKWGWTSQSWRTTAAADGDRSEPFTCRDPPIVLCDSHGG